MGFQTDSPPYDEHIDLSLADEEKKAELADSPPTNDPFGDESNGEVKYRTMSWW